MKQRGILRLRNKEESKLMKKCTKCGEEKPIEEFGKCGRGKVCVICRKDRDRLLQKSYYERNKERLKAYAKDYARLNRDKINKANCKRYEKNKEERKEYERKRRKRPEVIALVKASLLRRRFSQALSASRKAAKYGDHVPCNATEDEIREAFTGFCHNPECQMPEVECMQKLHLDHCHKTGEFRGWLCRGCNSMAGFSGDSPEILRGLAEYIEQSKTEGSCVNDFKEGS